MSLNLLHKPPGTLSASLFTLRECSTYLSKLGAKNFCKIGPELYESVSLKKTKQHFYLAWGLVYNFDFKLNYLIWYKIIIFLVKGS